MQALLPEAATVREELAHYAALTQRVVEQTVRRLAGEQVPATDKVVSLFEAHTAILRRNKPSQETECGHRVLLGEAEGGILTSYQILPGTEAEEVSAGSRPDGPLLGGVTCHRIPLLSPSSCLVCARPGEGTDAGNVRLTLRV